MTTIVINRKRGGLAENSRALPRNEFQNKERNVRISIREVLLDHPLTKDFAQNVIVSNSLPTPNEITFEFEGTLTVAQETDARTAIENFRDKDAFTALDILNQQSSQAITDVIELTGDDFNADNISELIIPDFCDLRDQVMTIYNNNGWSSFSIGEKRMLIADWLIPTEDEIKEVFQSLSRRLEIYRLFGYNVGLLSSFEMTRSIENLANDESRQEFNRLFKRLFTPSKVVNQVFVSRSQSNSDSSTPDVDVFVPVFQNVRESSDFAEVVDNFQLRITRDTKLDVTYNSTVNSNGSINWQVCLLVNNNLVDGQGMKLDGRGRNTVTHVPVRLSLKKDDILQLSLSRISSNASGNVVALQGKSTIRIDEVI